MLDWSYCARKITAVEIGVGKLQPYDGRILNIFCELGTESGAPPRSTKTNTRLRLLVAV